MKSRLFQKGLKLTILILVIIFFSVWYASADSSKEYFFEDVNELNANNVASSPSCVLEPGEYDINIEYISNSDTTLSVYTNEIYTEFYDMPSSEGSEDSYSLHVSIEKTFEGFKIVDSKAGESGLKFLSIAILSPNRMNNDRYFILGIEVISVLIGLFALVYFNLDTMELVNLFVVLMATILASLPVFKPYLISVQFQDLEFHLSRMESIRIGMLERQFPVMILPLSYEGFGMLGAMYPSLFIYVPALLRYIFGISTVVAWQFVDLTVNVATAFAMYISTKKLLSNNTNIYDVRLVSGVLTVLYLLSPYRLNNLYIRAAFGETLAMIFMPLVIVGLYDLLDNKIINRWNYLVIGMSGIIASHVISAVFACMLCAIFIALYYKSLSNTMIIKNLTTSIIATFLLSAWFIIPFIYYSVKENLDLAALDRIFTDQTLIVSDLFKNIPTYSNVELGILATHYSIGIIGLFLLIIGIMLLCICVKHGLAKFGVFSFTVGCLFIAMTLDMFPWKEFQKVAIINIIATKIQFPWRFLAISTPLIILGVGYMFCEAKSIIADRLGAMLGNNNKVRRLFASIGVSILAIIILYSSFPVIYTYMNHDRIIRKSDGGMATCTGVEEYLPAMDDNYENFHKAPTYAVCSSYDTIYAENYNKEGTNISFAYSCISDGEYVDVPLTYYSDYEAFELDSSGNKRILETTMSENGTLRVYLTKHSEILPVAIHYVINPIIRIAFIISAISLLFFVYSAIRINVKLKNT